MEPRLLIFPSGAWVLALTSVPSATVAQTPALSEISDKIRAAGAVIDVAQAAALYSPLQEKSPTRA
jgi:hypothetical protein